MIRQRDNAPPATSSTRATCFFFPLTFGGLKSGSSEDFESVKELKWTYLTDYMIEETENE